MNPGRNWIGIFITLVWLVAVGPWNLPLWGQTTEHQTLLRAGIPVEKALKAGETHHFSLKLSPGEFVYLIAEQKAIDLVLTILDPGGNQVVEVNYFDRMYGPEPAFWIAEQNGTYDIRVTPLKPSAPPGQYCVTVVTQRIATSQDRDCIKALGLMKQADTLIAQPSQESHQQGIGFYTEAGDLFHTLGYPWMEATAVYALGNNYALLGDAPRMIELYRQAKTLYRTAQDEEEVALMNFTLGGSLAKLRQFSEAISYFTEVMAYAQTSHQISWDASAQFELGSMYEDSFDSEKSFECYNRALFLAQQATDPLLEAKSLARLSRHYKIFGDDQRALTYVQQSLDMFRKQGNQDGEGLCLATLAWIYRIDGQPEKAITLYKQWFEQNKLVLGTFDEASLFTFYGGCYSELKDYAQALEYFTRSLELAQSIRAPALMMIALINVGNAYTGLKNYEKALDYFFQARDLAKNLKEPGYATLIAIATTYQNLGDISKAREFYQEAIENRRRLNQTWGLYDCYNQLAKFEYQTGNLQESKKLLQLAIDAIEQVRSRFVSPQNRALFYSYSQTTYDLLIDVLFHLHEKDPSAGYATQAFLVSEKRRARSLIEQLAESKIAPAVNIAPELIDRQQALAQTITTKTERLLPLREDDPERKKLQPELDFLSKELELVEAEIRKANPAFANLTEPQLLTVNQIQASVLDVDTQLVSYQLGDERSFAWVISKDRVDGFVLPKRSEVEVAVRTFVNHLTGTHNGGSTPDSVNATAKVVSDLILKPLASQLTAKRLLIIPDGALFYLPFGALPAQGNPTQLKSHSTPHYFIEQFELTLEPSVSTLAVLRDVSQHRPPAPQTAIVLANPVFSATDDRVKKVNPDTKKQFTEKIEAVQLRSFQEERLLSAVGRVWYPIPGTSVQAQIIQQLAGPTRCRVIEGFQASKQFLTQTDLTPFRIVHFATHGRFDSTRPEFSGLVLSLVDKQGQSLEGYLLSREIYNLKLNAELVVLSACESGLGKQLKGEGVIGLTRAFIYAGSPRVISSLWSVSDKSTVELMKCFYQHLLSKTNPLSPAKALRQAQIEMIHGKVPKWRIPFHWAAFQLQGEFR